MHDYVYCCTIPMIFDVREVFRDGVRIRYGLTALIICLLLLALLLGSLKYMAGELSS